MLSAQGHRLCHLHSDPIRGWRGRLSEDKFSTLGHTNYSLHERLLRGSISAGAAPRHQSALSSGGGTKGKDQARLRRGPAAALGSSERWGRAGARCEAIVFKLPCAGVRMEMPGCYQIVRDPVGPDWTREICMLLGSGALPRGGDLSAFAVPRRCAREARLLVNRDLFVPPTASSFPFLPTGIGAEDALSLPRPSQTLACQDSQPC